VQARGRSLLQLSSVPVDLPRSAIDFRMWTRQLLLLTKSRQRHCPKYPALEPNAFLTLASSTNTCAFQRFSKYKGISLVSPLSRWPVRLYYSLCVLDALMKTCP
jgi:hypothetical protein